MKHIDEIYKDWCGEHHATNSCHPVHDSAEACDFAEYYHKEQIKQGQLQREMSISFYRWLCKRHDYQIYNPNVNFDIFLEESNL